VVDASTVAAAPVATQALGAALHEGTAATAPVPGRAGRGRRLGLTLGALTLLAIGLAAAATVWLGRPLLLKADVREPRVPPPPAAPSLSQPVPPQAGAVHHEAALHQEDAAPRIPIARTNVEPAPEPPRIPRKLLMTIPAGTEIRLTLDKAVGSSSSHTGDGFTATITDPVVAGGRVAIPAGSSVHGRVSEAIAARKGLSDKAGSLRLSFEQVVTPDGTGAPMSAAMTRAGAKSGKKTAGIIGGSAAGGALLGKIMGGNTRSAAVGSVLGGAIGTGVAAGTTGQDVELAAGSVLTIKLDQPLTISIHP
jgi:hypothetical protein